MPFENHRPTTLATMVTECPHCRARFQVSSEVAGQRTECSKCGRPFQIVEHITSPQRFQDEHRHEVDPERDDILGPPVKTPSYKDTPILRTSFTRSSSAVTGDPGALLEDEYGRTPVGEDRLAPSYWGLRILSALHTYGGALAALFGAVVILSAFAGSPGGDASGEAYGRLLAHAWGFGLTAFGLMSVTLGRALRALRDIAINSYFAVR